MMEVFIIRDGEIAGRHDIDLAVDIRNEGSVMIQLRGERRKLSEIAADFEDAEGIVISDGREYPGFGDVIVLFRVDAETVQARIRRSVTEA